MDIKQIPIKDLLVYILIVFIILILVSLNYYGIEVTSKITQSFGIGLGSLFAGLAGLTAFLEWYDKAKRAEKYIKELKGKFPRKLLNKQFKIVQKTGTDMVYLIDERDKTSHWFKDREARKDLGYSHSDTLIYLTNDELAEYSEDDPIVSKKDY